MRFTVVDAQLDSDVRVGRVKIGNHFFECGLGAGVRIVIDNDQLAGVGGTRQHHGSHRKRCESSFHVVLPTKSIETPAARTLHRHE